MNFEDTRKRLLKFAEMDTFGLWKNRIRVQIRIGLYSTLPLSNKAMTMIRIHPRKESRMESPSILPQSGVYWTGWGYTIGGTVLVNYESGHCFHQEQRGSTEQVEYLLEAPPSLIQAFQSRMQK